MVLTGVAGILVPQPASVASDLASDPGHWAYNGWITLSEALSGLALAAVIAIGLAIAVTHSRNANRVVTPAVTMLQVTPVIALGPPIVLWLGFGFWPKVLMAALIAFVPLFANAAVGFRAVDPEALELFRSVEASRWELLRSLRFPHSVPYLFSALRVCVGLAIVGALVAEWEGSSRGLGYEMVRAKQYLATSEVWAAVVVLMAMGAALVLVVTAIERRVLRAYGRASG